MGEGSASDMHAALAEVVFDARYGVLPVVEDGGCEGGVGSAVGEHAIDILRSARPT